MMGSVCLHPVSNCVILVQPGDDFFKRVAVNFQKSQQMLVESDSFIVVTVEQAFAMKPGLVDQTRQMHIAAKFLVRTAWMQSLHGEDCCYVAGKGRGSTPEKSLSGMGATSGFCSCNSSPCVRSARPIRSEEHTSELQSQ